MAKGGRVFQRQWLTPGRLRAVAGYRFDDAMCLLASGMKGDKSRCTGAVYMGGFVIECLLKAILLARHPNLRRSMEMERLSATDREAYDLLFSHDLAAMIGFLPELERKAGGLGQAVWLALQDVCEEWTVYARYSPRLVDIATARRFMGTIQEVKEWLRQL